MFLALKSVSQTFENIVYKTQIKRTGCSRKLQSNRIVSISSFNLGRADVYRMYRGEGNDYPFGGRFGFAQKLVRTGRESQGHDHVKNLQFCAEKAVVCKNPVGMSTSAKTS